MILTLIDGKNISIEFDKYRCGFTAESIIAGEITPNIADKVAKMNREKAIFDDYMNKNLSLSQNK